MPWQVLSNKKISELICQPLLSTLVVNQASEFCPLHWYVCTERQSSTPDKVLRSVPTWKAAHPLLSSSTLKCETQSRSFPGISPPSPPFFPSHTMGIDVPRHVCAGVQITLSVSVRLSKKQDINTARRGRRWVGGGGAHWQSMSRRGRK